MRTWIAIGFVALAACGKDAPTKAPGVNTVSLSYQASFLLVGDTLQLTARVLDANAQPLGGATVEWSTSSATIATITPGGQLIGRATGEVLVTVRFGTSSASATFTVDPNPCTTPFTFTPGEVRMIRGARAFTCVNLTAATAVHDMLYVVGNARAAQDDTLSFSFSLGASTAALAPATFGLASEFDPREIVERQQMAYASDVEQRLRQFERKMLNANVDHLRAARARVNAGSALMAVQAAAQMAEGDTVTIRVPNLQQGKDICRDFITTRGIVRAISARATVVEDLTQPPGALSLTDYRGIASEFDTSIFPTDTLWFGSPTDLNSDNRITIYYTPEVNKLTPAGGTSIVGGFFFGGDLLRRSDYPDTHACRNQTNEQEVFYMLAPDPTGVINGNQRTTAGVRQVTRGTIAHEFQHMINQSVRQYNPAVKAFETFWLNEAMSHFAEEVVGRQQRSFGDFQSLRFVDVNPDQVNQNDYLAFFRQNLTRFRLWQLRPDTSSPTSVRARDGLASRGAAWALVRYAADHYSNGNARSFFRRLAAGPEVDIPNFLARTGNRPFDEVIGGWLVANYTDGLNVSGLASRFTYPSWDMRDAMSAVNSNIYPLLVNPLTSLVTSQVFSGSGVYYLQRRGPAAPAISVLLRTASGTPMTSPNARIWAVRVS